MRTTGELGLRVQFASWTGFKEILSGRQMEVSIMNARNLMKMLAAVLIAGMVASPVVLAKGAGHVAERIREIAKENHVPVVENKWVAQVLYRMVDIEGVIPESLYRAVAEILAYVYGLRTAGG